MSCDVDQCVNIYSLQERVSFQEFGQEKAHTSDVLIISFQKQELNVVNNFPIC